MSVYNFYFDSERQISEKLFHDNFIYPQNLAEIYWDSIAEIICFYISFSLRWLTWGFKRVLMSNKAAHYIIEYVDFFR